MVQLLFHLFFLICRPSLVMAASALGQRDCCSAILLAVIFIYACVKFLLCCSVDSEIYLDGIWPFEGHHCWWMLSRSATAKVTWGRLIHQVHTPVSPRSTQCLTVKQGSDVVYHGDHAQWPWGAVTLSKPCINPECLDYCIKYDQGFANGFFLV